MSKIAEALEQAQCAQINFDNLTSMNPAIQAHPMYKIARVQLDNAVQILDDLSKG